MPGLNETTVEQLAELNQNSFNHRIPALVFLALMLPLGILGNASVIYIYGFRLKQSNVHLFITLLAVSDITSCLVGIPMEMYRMFVFYNYTSIAACKVEGFFTIACYICSALLLLTISVERYVKVCRSTRTQVSRKMAKILAGAVFFVSSLFVVPLPVFVEPHVYTRDDGTVVQTCTVHIEFELWCNFIALFVVLLCVFGTMSALYWKVMKTTRSHVTWSQQRRAQTGVDGINDGTRMPMSAAETRLLSQTNRTVVWISAVYVASCVPIFIIGMVTSFTHLKAWNSLDFLLFLVFQSWTLNCTLNPIVYGVLNSKFRIEFRTLFHLNWARANSSSVEKTDE